MQSRRLEGGTTLQRLFSTFADGWPGTGLLILRITISAFLLRDLLARGVGNTSSDHALLAMVAAGTGVLLGIGLWTPVAGVLSAGVELSIALSRPGEFWICLLASGIASSLTLLGPGAWSLDAIAYGRKRISISGQ